MPLSKSFIAGIPYQAGSALQWAKRAHTLLTRDLEDLMSEAQSDTAKSLAQETSPYGYPYWEWVAREDPEYAKARIPLSELSVGEGKALSIKYREMVIIGILAFRGSSSEGIMAHMRRAIQYGATKRELLEAIQSAAVPGGGPTFATGCRALMQLDAEGAFKNG
jgi:alkylhydroperoxidase/carboxymuconolactone decarboxylase family protein YurZ